MILLDKDLIIASGESRTCYLHPNNPKRIVKIPHVNASPLNPENIKEIKMFQFLKKRLHQVDMVSQPYGIYETNLGYGLVCECIRDASGDISKPLFYTIARKDLYPFEKIREATHLFCNELIEKNIQLFDLNVLNILIQVRPDNSFKALSSDLKGRYDNKEFIPFSTFIPFFSRKKLIRRSKRLFEKIEIMHNEAKKNKK